MILSGSARPLVSDLRHHCRVGRGEVTDLFVTRLKPVCYAFETNEIEVEKGSEKNCPGPCWRGGTAFRPLGLVNSRFDVAPKVPK